MKTFSATQLNKSAQEVFAAVNEDGAVIIRHDRYQWPFIVEEKGHQLRRIREHIIDMQLSPSEIIALIDSHLN